MEKRKIGNKLIRATSRWLQLMLGAGIAAALLYGVLFSPFLLISKIDCQLTDSQESCSVDIAAELDRYRGSHVLQVKPDAIETRIVQADPRISSAAVTLRLPQTLLADITLRKTAVQITTRENNPQVLHVDNRGVVLGLGERSGDVPMLLWDGSEEQRIGTSVPNPVKQAINAALTLDLVWKFAAPPTIESTEMRVTLKEGPLVRLSLMKDLSPQLQTLQVLLDQARIGGIAYQSIDLRFEKPVVSK